MFTGRKKTGIILSLYSLAITLMLLFASIIFIKSAAPPKAGFSQIYVAAGNENIMQSMKTGSISIPLDSTKTSVLSTSTLEDYYMKELLRNFFPIMLCLFIIITFGTWILWRVLNKQNDKEALFIAKELSYIDEGNVTIDQHPAIRKSYTGIKRKLDAYVSDYVKLSSYITHEQKNILSLLRAKLQISGNIELINEVDKVTASIDDVLTLSAFKNMELKETIDAALVCANVCDDYRKVYPNIHFNFDEEGNYQIHARQVWIYRGVCNLVDNGIKYGNNSEIHVAIHNKKGSVIITVADKGRGIEPEYQERLFEDRYRISHLKSDGYGIGLNLVKHVCELCGGVVWVESEINQGTKFYLVFPEVLTLD